jgi:hypothetical protein
MQEEQAAVTGTEAESVAQEVDPFENALAELEKAMAADEGAPEGTDAAGEGTAADATPQAPPDQTTPEYWRKKFEDRDAEFKGLQGTVQRLTEGERRRELAEQEAAQKAFQERLAYMPEDQRNAVLVRAEAMQIAQAGQRALDVANAGARAQVITILSQRHGVSPEDLSECQSADEMERLAKRIEAERKSSETRAREARQAERAETGADAFGRGSAGTALERRPQTIEEAGDALVKILQGRRP